MNTEIMKTKFSYLLKRMYMRVYALSHPIQDKTILFSSFNGLQYSDNPRAISEKIHEMYPDYHIRWIIDRERDQYHLIPDYVDCIPSEGKKKFQAIATAHCYVYNMNLRNTLTKRKGQLFIQTWHGDRGFKKILYDVLENGGKATFQVMDYRYTDIAVSGSTFGTEIYRSAFCYLKRIEEVGSPRNDCLVVPNNELKTIVRERLHISPDIKVLLYAPTFRDNQETLLKVEINLDRVIQILSEKTASKWLCMVRAHPGAPGLNIQYSDQILDVTDYPDMADLLCVTDFLITDYSSSILDFYLTGKPSICFIPDKLEYIQSSRSFKADPEDVGVICAKTQEGLELIIKQFSQEDFTNAYKKIDKYYGTKEDGNASLKIAEIIDTTLKGKK